MGCHGRRTALTSQLPNTQEATAWWGCAVAGWSPVLAPVTDFPKKVAVGLQNASQLSHETPRLVTGHVSHVHFWVNLLALAELGRVGGNGGRRMDDWQKLGTPSPHEFQVQNSVGAPCTAEGNRTACMFGRKIGSENASSNSWPFEKGKWWQDSQVWGTIFRQAYINSPQISLYECIPNRWICIFLIHGKTSVIHLPINFFIWNAEFSVAPPGCRVAQS